MQYWSKELHLHQVISQTAQYLDSWMSGLLQSELKMKLLEIEGEARAPVSYSWRRHWLWRLLTETKTFRVAGLEHEGQDGHDWEEAAGQQEIDDVIERLATQMERESYTWERSVTAVVPDISFLHRNLCSTAQWQWSSELLCCWPGNLELSTGQPPWPGALRCERVGLP